VKARADVDEVLSESWIKQDFYYHTLLASVVVKTYTERGGIVVK
jgi:hypothetical protein